MRDAGQKGLADQVRGLYTPDTSPVLEAGVEAIITVYRQWGSLQKQLDTALWRKRVRKRDRARESSSAYDM